MRRTTLLVAALALAAMSFGQAADPKAAQKELDTYQQSIYAALRTSTKQSDYDDAAAKIKAKAAELVKGVDVKAVDPKTAADWARLFSEAGKDKETVELVDRFLGTKPADSEKFGALMMSAQSLNRLGDAKRLADTMGKIVPANAQQAMELSQNAQYVFIDTIKSKRGAGAALKVLDGVEKKMVYETPEAYADRMIEARKKRESGQGGTPAATINGSGVIANDEAKMREALLKQGEMVAANSKLGLATTRAELLVANKQRDKAIDLMTKTVDGIADSSPMKRSAKNQLTMLKAVGGPAPKLNVEKTIGEFASLEAWKGKVVLIDFFAHWCGPCIAAFPEMEKMYADLHPKGLEVVGVTTYYGYYKRENVQKRDMAKDVEFEHMKEFIAEHKLPWPVAYGDRSNFEAYGISGIPTVYVIDKKGTVHEYKVGYDPTRFENFRKEVEGLLKQ